MIFLIAIVHFNDFSYIYIFICHHKFKKKHDFNFERNINFINNILFIALSISLDNNFYLLPIEKKPF